MIIVLALGSGPRVGHDGSCVLGTVGVRGLALVVSSYTVEQTHIYAWPRSTCCSLGSVWLEAASETVRYTALYRLFTLVVWWMLPNRASSIPIL